MSDAVAKARAAAVSAAMQRKPGTAVPVALSAALDALELAARRDGARLMKEAAEEVIETRRKGCSKNGDRHGMEACRLIAEHSPDTVIKEPRHG